MAAIYINARHQNLCCIIYYTEHFIERQKGLGMQAQTWA